VRADAVTIAVTANVALTIAFAAAAALVVDGTVACGLVGHTGVGHTRDPHDRRSGRQQPSYLLLGAHVLPPGRLRDGARCRGGRGGGRPLAQGDVVAVAGEFVVVVSPPDLHGDLVDAVHVDAQGGEEVGVDEEFLLTAHRLLHGLPQAGR